MKKLLYVALAALMLISCDPNAPKIQSKDNKTIDNLSKNVLSLLGEKKKAAASTLEDLGFEQTAISGMLPQRLGLPATKEDAALAFFYGNIDAYEEAVEDEDLESLIDYLNEKKEIIIVVNLVTDESNKVSGLSVSTMAPAEVKNIHNLYAKFSKNVFLSLGDGKKWEGSLVEADEREDKDAVIAYSSAKKRDNFEEDFAAMEWPLAQEQGSDELDDDAARTYYSQWIGDASVMDKTLDGVAIGMFQAALETATTPVP